jgi:hypothetical protein
MNRWRKILLGSGAVLLFMWYALAWSEWSALQTGYTLSVGFESLPPVVQESSTDQQSTDRDLSDYEPTDYEVVHPMWRKSLTLVIAAGVTVGAVLLAFLWQGATAVLAGSFALALGVGIYDMWRYGTLAAPTSYKSLVLLLAMVLISRYIFRSNGASRNVA